MRFIGCSKKTVALLLCVLTLCVIFVLNNQLGSSSTRQRSRYDTRQTLSVPLTIDLSKNVTYINLPDANNELHRYKLERVLDGEQGTHPDGISVSRDQDANSDGKFVPREPSAEDKFVPRKPGATDRQQDRKAAFDNEDEDDDYNLGVAFDDRHEENLNGVRPDGNGYLVNNVTDDELKLVHTAGKPVERQAHIIYAPVVNNISTLSATGSFQRNYLLRFDDPRYPRMIGKLLSKLPSDVQKDMAINIRMAEAKSGMKFEKIHPRKQWDVLLKVFSAKGYEQKFPDVINIGVKKSGTNAMGFFLPQHPQIVHSIGNEVHYFDWLYDKGLEYYKSRMGFSKQGQLTFEKTPRYFVTQEAPGRIKRDLPKTPKFILCVRDPIARLISDFRHESELKLRKEIKTNRLKFSSRSGEFEGYRLKQEILDSRGEVNASNELVQTSIYIKHYKNWLQYYPASQIIIVDQDRMEKDTYQEMKRLEQFLGLRPYFKPSMFYYDQEKKGTCVRTSKLGPRNCPAKSTPSVLPKAILDPQTLQKVKDFYQPFNRELSELTNLRFSWAT